MQHVLTVSPFLSAALKLQAPSFLEGSDPSGEITLRSGNLKSVCNFLHLLDCGIYSSFLPVLSLQCNSYQQPSLLVLVQL